MTFDTEKASAGRNPIRLIEIDLTKCALSYGSSPCAAGSVRTGTAQAGGATSLTLDAGASAVDDAYNGMHVNITAGTGSGQQRTISDYVGATKVATVSVAWTTNPDATSVFRITNPNSATACYNTRKTCQDPVNFDGSATLTVKLCELTAEHQFAMAAIPCVEDIKSAHTQIEPGTATTGKDAGIAIRCVDFPHHDRGLDPYVANRTYTPASQGTYFGKLKARNPYYQDAVVRVKTGYWSTGYAAGNFKTRTYFLEKFEGPDKRGHVQLVAQSITRRLDDKRVTCPPQTVGKLTAALASGTTTNFTVLGDAGLYDTGGGSVAINKEVIAYATGTNNGNDTFTFSTLTRGVDGTTAAAHEQDDAAQKCVLFTVQTPRQIAYSLYVTYGGIPSSYIDTTQWDSVANTWLTTTYTRRLVKPTGIRKLLGDIHQQMAFFTWWDEEAGKVYLEAIRPPDYSSLSTFTTANGLVRESVEVGETSEKRITRVYVYYDPANPFEGDKPEHFRARVRGVDLNAEDADQFGDMRILDVFAGWLSSDTQATVLQGRLLNRFRDNLRTVKFDLDAKDEALVTAGHCYLNTPALQDADGASGTTLVQVVQRDEIKSGHRYAYRAWVSNYYGRYGLIAPAGTPDYGSATDAQKNRYGFIGVAGGANYADGGGPHKII